jgi:hypothetical protein
MPFDFKDSADWKSQINRNFYTNPLKDPKTYTQPFQIFL